MNNPGFQNLIATNQGVVNQLSAGIINRALDIQPMLRVRNGEQINVMVTEIYIFPRLKITKRPGYTGEGNGRPMAEILPPQPRQSPRYEIMRNLG
jgi:hypothetical protein